MLHPSAAVTVQCIITGAPRAYIAASQMVPRVTPQRHGPNPLTAHTASNQLPLLPARITGMRGLVFGSSKWRAMYAPQAHLQLITTPITTCDATYACANNRARLCSRLMLPAQPQGSPVRPIYLVHHRSLGLVAQR